METDKSMTRPVLRRPDDDNDGLVALPPVPLVRQRLRNAIDEARRSDLDPHEIESILREEWARTNGTGTAAAGYEANGGHA